MSKKLDPKDKALLKDVQKFNLAYAAAGWHLQDKVVTEDLSRVVLYRSSMNAVQFLYVTWKSAVLTDTQFTNVEFQQSDFTGVTLRDVVFRNCKFVVCSFARAKLTNCRFIDCTSEELNARDATFEGCVFERFEDNSGVFGSATLHTCSFEQCRMDNTSFYSTKFEAVYLKQSACTNVSFADIHGTGLSFLDATIHNCSFTGSRYGSVTFEQGKSKGLTFKNFNPTTVVIQNCEQIEALSILDSTWSTAAITDCRKVSELTIDRSRMKDLTISLSLIAYFQMEETEVSGNSRIVKCSIAGLNLGKSTLRGLQMASCEVSRYLMVEGATLDGVVLSGITYAAGLKVSTEGVKYLNGSAEFKAR